MNYLQLIRRNYHHLGFGLLHFFFSMPGQSILISLFKPHFNQQLGLEDEEFGLIYSIATMLSAFTLPFFGVFIDRYKVRYASLFNGLLLCLFTCVISFSNHWSILLIGLYGLRFSGQGMMVLIASTAISRYFDTERGKALSLSGLGLSLGEAIMPVVVVALIEGFEWSMAWRLLGLGILFIFMPLSFLSIRINDPFQLPDVSVPGDQGNKEVKAMSRKDVLRERRFYLILIPAIFPGFLLTGLFVHQDLLVSNKGWTMEWIATCFIAFGITKIATYFLSGPLVDRYTARRIFPYFLFPLVGGILALVLSSHPYAGIIYLSLSGMTNTLGAVLGAAIWAELYGVKNLGSIKSALSTFAVAGTSIGAVLFGWLLKDPELMMYTLIASILVMLVASYGAGRALNQYQK